MSHTRQHSCFSSVDSKLRGRRSLQKTNRGLSRGEGRTPQGSPAWVSRAQTPPTSGPTHVPDKWWVVSLEEAEPLGSSGKKSCQILCRCHLYSWLFREGNSPALPAGMPPWKLLQGNHGICVPAVGAEVPQPKLSGRWQHPQSFLSSFDLEGQIRSGHGLWTSPLKGQPLGWMII